ncbi:hypothetical protein CFB47_27395 [Burkholderia sp. AU27893]|uniref:Uncharacterized protein n=1 Tax=Burkholderia contaminans TaxID=488447 RepID=A0A2S5E1V4_9BURK|nr:hypothetical protein CFB47_27395 [Burkholderia sp. AU27893]POZ85383.1 hypothetical protein C3743_02130 [Burkholderia contaminans]
MCGKRERHSHGRVIREIRHALQPIETLPRMLNAEWRGARKSLVRCGPAAAGQRTAQPIVATNPDEFNRPESILRLPGESDRIIGSRRAALHIKMNRS